MKVKMKTLTTLFTILCLMLMIISYMYAYIPKYSTYHFAFFYRIFKSLSFFLSLFYFIINLIIDKESRKKIHFNLTIKIVAIIIFYETLVLICTTYNFDKLNIIDLYGWPFLFLQFYTEAMNKNIKKCYGYVISFLMLFIYVGAFQLIKIHLNGAGLAGSVVFPVYFCITFIPLLFYFNKNKYIRLGLIVISLFMIIVSTKRAGFIALILGIIAYISTGFVINKKDKNKLFKIILFLIFVLYGTNWIISNSNLAIIERINSLSKDNGSGRTIIWKIIWESYSESPIINKIFGHGFQSVVWQLKPQNMMRFAHNSYLEFLYDYGTIGVLLLLTFVVNLLKETINSIKTSNILSPILSFSVCIGLFLSMFSYLFDEFFIIIPLVIVWGICLGEKNIIKSGGYNV